MGIAYFAPWGANDKRKIEGKKKILLKEKKYVEICYTEHGARNLSWD